MRTERAAGTLASVGRSMLATGAGAALGMVVWMLVIVSDRSQWEGYAVFAAGVGLAAGLGMSRQPLLGAVLAAGLSVVPLLAFHFAFLSVLPALITAGGAMCSYLGTQPLRPALPARQGGGAI